MLPSEQVKSLENMKGDFVGIGVNFFMYKDSLAIIKPIEMVLRQERESRQVIGFICRRAHENIWRKDTFTRQLSVTVEAMNQTTKLN
jgi:hypothetical protein